MRLPMIGMTFLLILTACSGGIKTVDTAVVETSRPVPEETSGIEAGKWLEQGIENYRLGNYNRAIKELTRSIAAFRPNWETHYYLGLSQQKVGHYDRAIGAFNNSLKYCPPDRLIIADINCALGLSWEKSDFLHKAESKYRYALRLNPELTEAQTGINRVRAKEAQTEAEKAKDERAY